MDIIFDLTLEASILKLDTSEHIGIKTLQICAYADDVAIISRGAVSLKEVTAEINGVAETRGLEINGKKKIYGD